MDMMLYSLKSADGALIIAYKEKIIQSEYNDTLHNYDECKIVRILDGVGVWQINNCDVPFSANDVFIFSRLDFRKIRCTDKNVVFEQVNFLPASLGAFGGCTEIFFSRSEGFTNKITDDRAKQEICACFDLLRQDVNESDSSFKNELIISTVIRMALLTARAYKSINSHLKGDSFVSSVMQYVTDNLYGDLSACTVADKFGFSQAYFSQNFKKKAGISFSDYVATRRINSIILELNRTNENILDIALKCGFKSSSGFYKTFTRLTGASPKSFRN